MREVVEHPERQRTHALCAGNAGHVNDGMQPLQVVSARRIRSGAHESMQEAGTSASGWRAVASHIVAGKGVVAGGWHDDARDWG